MVGLQPVREAIRVHRSALGRLVLEDRPSPRLDAVARFAADQGVERIERASRAALDRLSGGVSHQGVAATAPSLELVSLESLLKDPALAAVALDGIQDPQNFGALVRSAVAIAGAAIVWAEHGSAPLGPATFRASAGAIEHARLCRVRSLGAALGDARDQGATVVGLDPHAPVALRDVDLRGRVVLVIGSEHEGLGRAIRRTCTVLTHLVEPGQIESLNASVAAGIALYELTIQRYKSII